MATPVPMRQTEQIAFGNVSGERAVTTTPADIFDGLTVSKTVLIKALNTNTGDIFVLTDGNSPFRLGPGETVEVDTLNSRHLVKVYGSVNGLTVTYIGRRTPLSE